MSAWWVMSQLQCHITSAKSVKNRQQLIVLDWLWVIYFS